jgi:hypothetical protein
VNGLAGADGQKVRFVWDLILIYVTLKFIQVSILFYSMLAISLKVQMLKK